MQSGHGKLQLQHPAMAGGVAAAGAERSDPAYGLAGIRGAHQQQAVALVRDGAGHQAMHPAEQGILEGVRSRGDGMQVIRSFHGAGLEGHRILGQHMEHVAQGLGVRMVHPVDRRHGSPEQHLFGTGPQIERDPCVGRIDRAHGVRKQPTVQQARTALRMDEEVCVRTRAPGRACLLHPAVGRTPCVQVKEALLQGIRVIGDQQKPLARGDVQVGKRGVRTSRGPFAGHRSCAERLADRPEDRGIDLVGEGQHRQGAEPSPGADQHDQRRGVLEG